jgi:hypothetical protein
LLAGAGDLPSGSSGELLNMKLKDASSSPPRTDDIRQSDMQSSRKDKKKKKKKKKRENNEKREKKEKRSKREGSPAEGEKAGEKPRHRSAKGQNLIVPVRPSPSSFCPSPPHLLRFRLIAFAERLACQLALPHW